jgi:DNA-directed RNA polymerase specialized sigma24 family protein
MPHPKPTPWPPLDDSYTDEFGHIDADVYGIAGSVWPQAEAFANTALHDGAAGLRLMIKAVALVSRARLERGAQISNLPAYIFRTYKRLVLASLEIQNGHRKLEIAHTDPEPAAISDASASLDELILIQQIIGRMDVWTRSVFELLTLGLTYDEIGEELGASGHVTRTKYSKRIKRLIKQLDAETKMAAVAASKAHKILLF